MSKQTLKQELGIKHTLKQEGMKQTLKQEDTKQTLKQEGMEHFEAVKPETHLDGWKARNTP